jgi:serine/threonine protein phosphatase PrpC
LANEKFLTNSGLFAVFDGHGGNKCAEYCRQNLEAFVAERLGRSGDIHQDIKEAFSRLDL